MNEKDVASIIREIIREELRTPWFMRQEVLVDDDGNIYFSGNLWQNEHVWNDDVRITIEHFDVKEIYGKNLSEKTVIKKIFNDEESYNYYRDKVKELRRLYLEKKEEEERRKAYEEEERRRAEEYRAKMGW